MDSSGLEQVRPLELTVRQAVRQGVIGAVPGRAVAFAVFDLSWGLIAGRLRGWSDVGIDEDVSFAVDLLWKGMSAR